VNCQLAKDIIAGAERESRLPKERVANFSAENLLLQEDVELVVAETEGGFFLRGEKPFLAPKRLSFSGTFLR
jgi:hypothetical protein